MKAAVVFALVIGLAAWPASAESDTPKEAPKAAVKTAKERQAGKAYDPQRVNDCKVPSELRDDKKRPADCSAKAKAAQENTN